VRGRLGADPEETFGKNDERFTRFGLCVDSYENGKDWYTMLGKHEIVDFVLRHLLKGNSVTCEGEVSIKPYTDKQGRSRIDRTMRLQAVELPDGERCEATERVTVAQDPEELERLYWEKRSEDLSTYPPRWERQGFFDSAGGKRALEKRAALWQGDSPVHDPMAEVPSEVIGQLIKELTQELSG
jgi:hypothetical protein